ncbi:hypothetical protein VTN96DRAFT_9959 [Rasamsonia emersonii]|uniref:HLH transcription factor n=1 Tax=Rasamsonia emersonii (strain ATCC 16479 / CBS 393.64 / IMI 116815) TaxID=1408163 RepID=A0A0F4Z3C3_RASE3|nr:HLH transcription factor [Rasamsonia emersonii CBS 393.64]KKA24378.1 HLH transcription factor [Rasamsonia emersonii CBS 393.64]
MSAAPVDGGLGPSSSPVGGSGTHESRSDEPSLTTGSGNEVEYDWSQWMRWDWDDITSQTKSNHANDPSNSGLVLDPVSVNTTQSPVNVENMDFSADVSPPGSLTDPTRDWGSSVQGGRHVASSSSSYWKGWDLKNPSTSLSPQSNSSSTRKRKTTSDDDGSAGAEDDSPPESKLPAKKRSHNVIEKRYRANLNEKIAELRDSVPSLRAMSKQGNGSSPGDDDPDGAIPANKLNKASILSKATKYIHHLELRNKRLEEENRALKERLRQLDKLIDQSATASSGSASSPGSYTGTIDSSIGSPPSVFSHAEEPSPTQKPASSLHPPEGLLKVPDYIKQMRASAATDSPFAKSYIQDDRKSKRVSEGDGGGRPRMGLTNKFMLGTLAGLMVVESISTQKKTESTDKGLLAVPFSFLNDKVLPYIRAWHANMNMGPWNSWHVRAISNFLLTAVLVVGCAFVVFLYLFNSRPGFQRSPPKTASDSATAMTPSAFRRQAWLTSIQRVGVPRHRFFLEWFAVTSRWIEYTLGCLLGWKLYSWITGITEEDEKGRVKTWDIAIDAQLAGGDAEVSKSRLVLTIFAAGTLPRSPERMMLKALHCRILLWRLGEPGSFIFRVANDIARLLARYQWGLARKMNRSLPKDHPDSLPSHLAALVERECDEVMIDSVIQRAANLTWNRPTQEATDDDEALLDVVVEDPAIRSSLDSLAAWWSSHVLQRALLRSFEAGHDSPSTEKSRGLLREKLELALNVAPRPSAAYTRALAMKAVFFEEDRIQNIGAVLAALPSKKDKQTQASNFLDSSIPVSVREEIAIAVRCAMIAAILKARATNDTSLPSYLTVRKAIAWFNQLPLDPVELTLVGFTAVYHLLHVVTTYGDLLSASSSSESSSPPSSSGGPSPASTGSWADDERDRKPGATHKRTRSDSITEPTPQYGRVAEDLMYWARHAYNPAFYGFTNSLVDIVEAECIAVCKDVGIDVADHTQSVRSSLRKIMKAERKHRKQHTTGREQTAVEGEDSKGHRRHSLESNDTGYGSGSGSGSYGDDHRQSIMTPLT